MWWCLLSLYCCGHIPYQRVDILCITAQHLHAPHLQLSMDVVHNLRDLDMLHVSS